MRNLAARRAQTIPAAKTLSTQNVRGPFSKLKPLYACWSECRNFPAFPCARTHFLYLMRAISVFLFRTLGNKIYLIRTHLNISCLMVPSQFDTFVQGL